MQYYTSRKQKFETQLSALKIKYNQISILRLLLIVLCFISGYYYLQPGSNVLYLTAMALCITAFIYVMRYHSVLARRKLHAATIVAINDDEIHFLKREKNTFDNGAEYTDHKHSYLYDLDIFGTHSLFQHINRTETWKGKDVLASLFKKVLPQEQITDNQEAVKELADKTDWRQEITALGRIKKDDKAIYNKLIDWSNSRSKAVTFLQNIIAVVSPFILVACFVTYLITDNTVFFSACGYLFVFNLICLSTVSKSIKAEINYITEIDEIIHNYSLIINLIENENFNSEKLNKLKNQLYQETIPASRRIKKLAELFSRMDSIGNLFAAVLFNGLFLFHIHTLKSLQGWKEKNAKNIEGWLNVIAEVEALSSLGNFYYNNKGFVFPQLNTQNKISFKNLAHPLLNPDTRIGNDIDFEPHFTILTGSNMSGKSTFLRSLGVNMMLAGIGAPVCASSAVVHPLPILVSMRLSDSLSDSESYFFAEVKRLKEIMEKLDKKQCFVLLDEILRGTNSDDKRAGTIGVIKKMVQKNALGAIATHDIEVCNIAADFPHALINRCFEAEINEGELYFDYKLRNGVCRNKSATFLMEKMGVI
jgi:DNA mismatch repair ATPase MutS